MNTVVYKTQGMSLISLLIVAAVGGILSLGIYRLMTQQFSANRHFEHRKQMRETRYLIAKNLDCAKTIAEHSGSCGGNSYIAIYANGSSTAPLIRKYINGAPPTVLQPGNLVTRARCKRNQRFGRHIIIEFQSADPLQRKKKGVWIDPTGGIPLGCSE